MVIIVKIELDEKDKNLIDKINRDLDDGVENLPVFINAKRNYSVSFDVTDIAKANNFIYEVVMCPDRERNKQIEDLLGVSFTSINYSTGDVKLSELKQKIKEFLHELDAIG